MITKHCVTRYAYRGYYIIIALILLICAENASAQWTNTGSAGFSAGTASFISMATDASGVPYVAYRDVANSDKATVMKYNGSSWVAVGNVGFSPGQANNTSLAIDRNGVPYVAYLDGGNDEIVVMKYDGNNWVAVGNAGFSGGPVADISLAIDGTGTPYVAYQDLLNSSKATVMKYDGMNWVVVGTAGFSAGASTNASLAINGNGTPYVAFRDYANSSKATVMKYNGNNWVVVGTAGFSVGASTYISLVINGSDTPYVAYRDAGNNNKAAVMRYNGSNWMVVGSAGFSAGASSYISLAINGSGTPYIAYQDGGNSNKATVMKYNGSGWVKVGIAGFSAGTSDYISLAISNKGTLYVAYRDYAKSYAASVMQYGYNTWTGATDASWITSGNWSSGNVPTSTTDVVIPPGCNRYPVISGLMTPACYSLNVFSGASLSVGASGQLNIYGDVANMGTIDVVSGKIKYCGYSAQVIGANTFSGNTICDLEIANSAGVMLVGNLKVTGILTPTSGILTTGGYLILASSSNRTSQVASGGASGGYISGAVIVERHIAAKSYSAWHLLSSVTIGNQTINSAWQEGASSGTIDPNPGYGTLITGDSGMTTSDGFDVVQTKNSILAWDVTNQNWTNNAITNTNVKKLSSEPGYYLFIRGDRSVGVSSSISGSGSTILRSMGSLRQGDQSSLSIAASKLTLVGNPYASAIDFSLISTSDKTNVNNRFWLWDPQRRGTKGVGGWVLFDNAVNWAPNTTGGSYSSSNSIIPNGMAFMVEGSSSTGTLTIRESIKSSSSRNTGFKNTSLNSRIHIELGYYLDSVHIVKTDGAYVVFSDDYSNDVDDDDAVKLISSLENLGIAKSGRVLALEAHAQISDVDTMYIDVWGEQQQQYHLDISPDDMQGLGLDGELVDRYTATSWPIDMNQGLGYTYIVTSDSGSQRRDRFYIVLHKASTEVLNHFESNGMIKVYPNPNDGSSGIQLMLMPGLALGGYQLELIGMDGHLIVSNKIAKTSGYERIVLGAERVLTPGIYTLVLRKDKGDLLSKVPVEIIPK